MTMQHKRGEFEGKVSIKGLLKLDKIADEQRIRISNLAMASRRIIADYPDSCPWYCLAVRTGSEFTVEKYLYEENVEVLVPTRKTAPKYSRGRMIEPQKRPVMPGYVLVQCAASAHAFLALRRVKHVIGIIGGAEMPYRIPLKHIEKFRERARSGGYDYRPVGIIDYRLGEVVRVIEGPFASFSAEVIAFDGEKHRIEVEVEIFGRKTPVELDVAQIEKV
ncbi:transcription termination/antitermination protein NusG [Rhizobium binae]|uniref:transcription termination/antitermination protein NusG n=1 Tax=Rhizobium binae TaxID=1138190 RepID=UPI001C834414|nr:transcription termination/antitermination NusG family protein [Rhizobium binae]MBX4944625.1 transcription antiterminator [Rhizobium binae]MBX4980656.1 transcription antiterminator [Rhizobium binae]